MSNFDDDFAAVETLFTEVFGVTVDYVVNGATAVAGMAAQVALNQYQIFDSEGIAGVAYSRDYLVEKALLISGGSAITPAPRHKIKETIGGVVRSFEVMQLAGRPCFEPADANDRQLVIHTKEVS